MMNNHLWLFISLQYEFPIFDQTKVHLYVVDTYYIMSVSTKMIETYWNSPIPFHLVDLLWADP